MSRLISTVCAATLMASTAVIPSTASPLGPQPSFEVNDSLIQVGSKNRYDRDRYIYRDRYYGKNRYNYKRHNNNNNWWIPGAIIGGIIIGGALSQPRYRQVQPAGSCGYWSQRCSANWSRPSDYRGCMRYYGCY